MPEGRVARWVAIGVTIAGATALAEAMGIASWNEPGAELSFSGTIGWAFAAPVAIAATVAIAWWNAFDGDRRLARWALACAAATTLYALASATVVWLPAHGGARSPILTAAATMMGAGWTVVLALLQAAVLATGESAVGRPFGRRTRATLLSAAGLVIVAFVLFPPVMDSPALADIPTLLPQEVARSAAGVVTPVVGAVWMLSTGALPVALWVAAARSRGVHRRMRVRLALAASLPPIVVLLCGVLAAMATSEGDGRAELGALAVGFAVAVPTTLGWLTATVRDATAISHVATTTVPTIVLGLMWPGYVLLVFQASALLSGAWGNHPNHGVLTTTLLFAVTFVPWLWLTRWCVSRSDPRWAFTNAARGAALEGLPAATVAEHALREALASPDARLLVRRSPRRWTAADGSPAQAPPTGTGTVDDHTVLAISDEAGRTIAALTHGSRFVDTRSLATLARPLVERAILEADVHEQADLALAERRRADDATHAARRRMERDLHDGVQGRLVSLGLGLSLARDESPDPAARDVMHRTVEGLHEVVAELRELSSGTVSTRLTRHGLAAAVGDLVRRLPLPVDVDVPALRLPAPVEETAYFVIAEALANVVKHAAAGEVRVKVDVADSLVVTVADNGVGGVDPRRGTGLRGLQERVHAVGGRLLVSDARPRGTLVEAVLPCGW